MLPACIMRCLISLIHPTSADWSILSYSVANRIQSNSNHLLLDSLLFLFSLLSCRVLDIIHNQFKLRFETSVVARKLDRSPYQVRLNEAFIAQVQPEKPGIKLIADQS
ncbi:hypothetical protein MLD38_000969 [Melastoma candidum]|uniref:Uncharacterized protein n=1 Tax=Melastoma candidum TaxID=119954 RepID=A0ACB9SC66_9MYRT|nr:hypothetical protein MLD38_000969 [Melastoma candidum]